jgi:hypothetical protein
MEKREFVAQAILHAISSRLIGLGDNESEASDRNRVKRAMSLYDTMDELLTQEKVTQINLAIGNKQVNALKAAVSQTFEQTFEKTYAHPSSGWDRQAVLAREAELAKQRQEQPPDQPSPLMDLGSLDPQMLAGTPLSRENEGLKRWSTPIEKSKASYPVEPLPPGLDLTGEGSECES